MSYREDFRGPPRESRDRPRGGNTLYVTGFGPGMRARDLAFEFENCGRLVRCDIPAPQYEDPRDARVAFDELHKKKLGEFDQLKLEWARTPPSANWRFDGGEAPRGAPPRDRRDRSPRRDRGGYRERSRSPMRDRGRNGYSPGPRDGGRDRDFDRRDRDDRRERDYDRPARSPPRGDGYRDRDMKDRDADGREPDDRANGDDVKAPIDQQAAASGHDELDTAE